MSRKDIYTLCKTCTHTENIHSEDGSCGAWKCSCPQLEK